MPHHFPEIVADVDPVCGEILAVGPDLRRLVPRQARAGEKTSKVEREEHAGHESIKPMDILHGDLLPEFYYTPLRTVFKHQMAQDSIKWHKLA